MQKVLIPLHSRDATLQRLQRGGEDQTIFLQSKRRRKSASSIIQGKPSAIVLGYFSKFYNQQKKLEKHLKKRLNNGMKKKGLERNWKTYYQRKLGREEKVKRQVFVPGPTPPHLLLLLPLLVLLISTVVLYTSPYPEIQFIPIQSHL